MDLEKFHLVTRLAYQAAHYKDREAIRYWEEGQWRPMSWTVFYDKIQELAKAFPTLPNGLWWTWQQHI